MALEEPEEDSGPTAPFWMTTYGDMVTLLLTFFILMFAMSTVNEQKFFEAAASLSKALGVLDKNVSVIGERSIAIGLAGNAEEQLDMLEALEQIAEVFEEESLEEVAEIDIIGPGEILIRLGDEVLFDPGEALLTLKARRILTGITRSLVGKTKEIFVEGHTDNVPINSTEFPSNWELSSARALSVVKLMEEIGIPPDQLGAIAHGEFRPLGPNDTPAGRGVNRRVELYITWSEEADSND